MGNNSFFIKSGQRIKEKREECNMTMEELGKKLGVNKSTIKRYEDGSTKRITIATYEKLANILNTTPAYLMGGEGTGVISSEEAYEKLKSLGYDISRYAKSSAKVRVKQNKDAHYSIFPSPVPILSCERFDNTDHVLGYTYIEKEEQDHYFAVMVSEDSMNAARIFKGDIVVCRRQSQVNNGEIAVIVLDHKAVTIKRVYINGHIVTLMPQSTNNIHQPMILDNRKTHVQIAGRVIKVEFLVN